MTSPKSLRKIARQLEQQTAHDDLTLEQARDAVRLAIRRI